MNTKMDKYWELIIQYDKLIWATIHKYTKYNTMDIYQEATLRIFAELCKIGGTIDKKIMPAIVRNMVYNAIRYYADYNTEIPHSPEVMYEIGVKNKKQVAHRYITCEGR